MLGIRLTKHHGLFPWSFFVSENTQKKRDKVLWQKPNQNERNTPQASHTFSSFMPGFFSGAGKGKVQGGTWPHFEAHIFPPPDHTLCSKAWYKHHTYDQCNDLCAETRFCSSTCHYSYYTPTTLTKYSSDHHRLSLNPPHRGENWLHREFYDRMKFWLAKQSSRRFSFPVPSYCNIIGVPVQYWVHIISTVT
jgi:hypothetical protein